jgi:hypothetical protein
MKDTRERMGEGTWPISRKKDATMDATGING